MIVRPAGTADIPWLLDELRAFDEFFGSSRSLFPTYQHAEFVLTDLIANQPILVADNDRGPCGFIAGYLAPHPLNPEIMVLNELFWWVTPDARGSRAGMSLLTAFEAIGRQRADWIVMTLEAESPVDPRSLRMRGYRAKETNYLLEVDRAENIYTRQSPLMDGLPWRGEDGG